MISVPVVPSYSKLFITAEGIISWMQDTKLCHGDAGFAKCACAAARPFITITKPDEAHSVFSVENHTCSSGS